MSKIEMRRASFGPRYQRAFSLVELMISIVIGIFLLSGVIAVFVGTRQTSIMQGQLSQLQDNQRLALTLITDVVQEAGYFYNVDPLHLTTLTTALPASSAPFTQAGQMVAGDVGPVAPGVGDSISVRFQTKNGDGVIHCLGGTNTTAAPLIYVNKFSIANNELVCSVNGATAVPLVSGIQNMFILYGVDTDLDGAADRYLDANAMTPAYWLNVITVKITLSFINPMANQAGQASHQVIPITRVINVMSKS